MGEENKSQGVEDRPEGDDKDVGNAGSLAAELSPFFEANPHSELLDRPGSKAFIIRKAWGEEGISLFVRKEPATFLDVLNNVRLPQSLTAIYHIDTKDLEFIFTTFPLTGSLADLEGRKFLFRHNSKSYTCEFARSSERLLAIAKWARPVSESITGYRNLVQFFLHERQPDKKNGGPSEKDQEFSPTSYWIRSIGWDQDAIVELIRHMNFFCGYYDTLFPEILIHSTLSEELDCQPQTRYTEGKFPKKIVSSQIDDNLLHFWAASKSGDAARKFLYSYRIIEYASFYYLELSARQAVKKIMMSPSLLDDVGQLSERVLAAMQDTKLNDGQKIEALIRETVSADAIWREITLNKKSFIGKTKFEGGFSIDPLIKGDWKKSDFAVHGLTAFARTIKDIRNALSHGRDQKTTLVITPTAANFERLQPWVSLIAVAAAEVMVYKNLT